MWEVTLKIGMLNFKLTLQWWSIEPVLMLTPLDWITTSDHRITFQALWRQNTARVQCNIACAHSHVCLLSLSRHTWKWGDRVCGRDPGDKNNHCPYNRCLSSSPAHTQVGPVLSPQDGSHRTVLWRSAQRGRNRTNESEDSALCVSNDWQHVGLLTEALVMVNLLHVLVLYSVSVNRYVCLSVKFMDLVVCWWQTLWSFKSLAKKSI